MNEKPDSEGIELPGVTIKTEEEIILFTETAISEAGEIIAHKVDAINQICEMIFKLKDPVRQSVLSTDISKRYNIPKKIINDKLKALKNSMTVIKQEDKDSVEGFDVIDKEVAQKLGFFEHQFRYYFMTKEGPYKASNFIIRPLFHIYSKTDNKRLIEIINEDGYKKTIDVPSKSLVNLDQFLQAVINEGAFLFYGNKSHFMKIIDHIANKFPLCNELKTLGWQREGFYAFSNGIYSESWQPVDEFGITIHGQNKYFSAAFSRVYSEVREDDDDYESDRYFVWCPSPITFGEWTRLMIDVYGPKARIAISFTIASVFRDLIYEKYKIFPHLFLFGEKQSGKSQLAWSLSNLFFNICPLSI